LKQDVVSRNPGLSEEDADRLIPHKADVSVSKIQTQAHGVVSVHLVDGVPLFFSPAKDKSGDGLLPTVYALWKCPVLAPRPLFHVHVSRTPLSSHSALFADIIFVLGQL
jgi:hypothetical protein